MKYRTLGKSDLEIPVITFGAWAIGGWYWGGTDDEKAIRAIHKAVDLGINCIDTAPMYGMGHGERIVGEAIRGQRSRFLIATKCGLRWDVDEQGQSFFTTEDREGKILKVRRWLSSRSIVEECERSLKRMGIETIDLYQCHFPDKSTPAEETMDALLTLQKEGKIRAIGVSNFSPTQIEAFLSAGPVASNQPKYSLLSRKIERDLLPFCLEHEVGILAYSPLEQGLLTGKVTMDRILAKGDMRISQPWFKGHNRERVLQALEEVKNVSHAHQATLGQVAIAWIIAQPGVTSAIVGARNPRQVEENAGAAALTLSEDELMHIRQIFENLGKPE